MSSTWYSKSGADVLLALKANTADLATVATTGSYSDLTDKPAAAGISADSGNQLTTGSDSGLFVPAAPVTSVAGKTGVVDLVKGDVGLGSVDNTADSAKPVSTAQASALALKADISSLASVATSGSAADLSSGLLGLARLPAGALLCQPFTAANAASLARPTSRTDVAVFWIGDATTSSSTLPANALAGDPITVGS